MPKVDGVDSSMREMLFQFTHKAIVFSLLSNDESHFLAAF